MRRDRATAAVSVVLSLVLGTWMLAMLLEPAPLAEHTKTAENEVRKPAPEQAMVVLPPPPRVAVRPLAPAVHAAAPTEAKPVPKIEPLKPRVPEPRPEPMHIQPLVPEVPKQTPPPPAMQTPPERMEPARAETEPAPDTPSETVVANADVVSQGRTRLRILEHGSGPGIEIAWPEGAEGGQLFQVFRACYGLRVALMADGKLYTDSGPRGEPWQINLDRYSGFVRAPAGWLPADERKAVGAIRARHGGLGGAAPVRVFPRRVDALLLGGLGHVIGNDYDGAKSIRASYRLDGRRVLIDRVYVDGRAQAGRIDLAGAARCR